VKNDSYVDEYADQGRGKEEFQALHSSDPGLDRSFRAAFSSAPLSLAGSPPRLAQRPRQGNSSGDTDAFCDYLVHVRTEDTHRKQKQTGIPECAIKEFQMKDERRQILDMLAAGKISVDEAERLLSAISSDEAAPAKDQGSKKIPKYLRVLVEPGPGNEDGDKVNIRVPMKLIRAGLKWAAFIPKAYQGKVDSALQESGIDMDLSNIKPEDLEDIMANLDDLTVDVEGKEKVRIFCE
jgi:hypothetical protein